MFFTRNLLVYQVEVVEWKSPFVGRKYGLKVRHWQLFVSPFEVSGFFLFPARLLPQPLRPAWHIRFPLSPPGRSRAVAGRDARCTKPVLPIRSCLPASACARVFAAAALTLLTLTLTPTQPLTHHHLRPLTARCPPSTVTWSGLTLLCCCCC